MIVGDKAQFAIESSVAEFHNEKSLLGIGSFLIHICGCRYGVSKVDATALACSFDSIARRIDKQGMHIAPFSTQADPLGIALAFRQAVYSADECSSEYFGIPEAEFADIFYKNDLIMAPDGDAAFDDSSYILQFDIGDQVRLIGFRCGELNAQSPDNFRDAWIDTQTFYSRLKEWKERFAQEWSDHTS